MLNPLPRLTAILILFIFTRRINSLEIDERCNPSRLPYNNNGPATYGYDYNRCDPHKGLYCNEYSRCACYVPDSYYDYYLGRCIAKVGHPCKATYTFSIPCGDNAECPHDSGFCQCRNGYFPSYDRRSCTNSARKAQFTTFLPFLTLILTWITAELIF